MLRSIGLGLGQDIKKLSFDHFSKSVHGLRDYEDVLTFCYEICFVPNPKHPFRKLPFDFMNLFFLGCFGGCLGACWGCLCLCVCVRVCGGVFCKDFCGVLQGFWGVTTNYNI